MAHNIIPGMDAGILEGNQPTWHGMKEYKLMGDEPIKIEDVEELVNYPIEVRPMYIKRDDDTYQPVNGSNIVCRVLPNGSFYPLGRAVGSKFAVIPRRQILHSFDEGLLAKFSGLKISGAGTLGGGATFWMQTRVEDYNIRGDQSDHQLRLSYTDTYGESAKVFCTGVRIVCQNTLRYGMMDAMAQNMFSSIRHTSGAVAAVEAKMELFAKIHLGLMDEIEELERLTKLDVDGKYVEAFVEKMFPMPDEPDEHRVTRNRVNAARDKVIELFENSSETMDREIATSRYALLQAFTDTVDHHVYYRSPGRRWQESLDGVGAIMKDQALEYLQT